MNCILKRLEKKFPVKKRPKRDAFSALIAVILSQNTSDLNSSKAFKNLCLAYNIKPAILAKLDPKDIEPLIKVAGLQKNKSNRIVEISKFILKRYNGELEKILELPLEEARKALMDIKGIGPKSADVLLAFNGGKPVLPIDTNIFKIANRTGLVEGRNYEKTRASLESYIPACQRLSAHTLLIQLGKLYCKALRPLCGSCPISDFCEKKGIKIAS